jgi:Uma2 family endonuclease
VILPTLIVEVLSPSTETTDRREKKMNYLQV